MTRLYDTMTRCSGTNTIDHGACTINSFVAQTVTFAIECKLLWRHRSTWQTDH
jgi:hypothetical protein